MASYRTQQWIVALIAAGASVAGGLIAGGASYLAAREANQGVIQRDERNDQLAARSAARLVDNELALVAVRLTFLQKQPHLNAASLARALRKLPSSEWRANQQVLARTLTVHDWGDVSQAYVMTEAFASEQRVLGIPGLSIRLLEHDVSQARDDLMAYE
jgi:hypothetical protein